MPPYDGEERREHERECKIRLQELSSDIKLWTADKICIATKGQKVWNKVMRPIVMLLLSIALGGQLWGYVLANAGQAKDTEQDGRITHLEKIVDEHHKEQMKGLESMGEKQTTIQRDVQQINGDVQKILGILEGNN